LSGQPDRPGLVKVDRNAGFVQAPHKIVGFENASLLIGYLNGIVPLN
jgi:hypothetical protein